MSALPSWERKRLIADAVRAIAGAPPSGSILLDERALRRWERKRDRWRELMERALSLEREADQEELAALRQRRR